MSLELYTLKSDIAYLLERVKEKFKGDPKLLLVIDNGELQKSLFIGDLDPEEAATLILKLNSEPEVRTL